jgi:hypothetical protein
VSFESTKQLSKKKESEKGFKIIPMDSSPTKKPPAGSSSPKKKPDIQPTRQQLLDLLRAKEAIDQTLVKEIDQLQEVCKRQQAEHAKM